MLKHDIKKRRLQSTLDCSRCFFVAVCSRLFLLYHDILFFHTFAIVELTLFVSSDMDIA